MIICIEGLTNSGKSTLCNYIVRRDSFLLVNDFLKDDIVTQNIKKITGPIGNIERFDEKTELLLYSALLSEKAYKSKNLPGNILFDRFALSVYSYFTVRYNLDKPFIEDIVKYSSRDIIPDLTVFLDVSLETIMKRAEKSPFTRKDIGIENYYSELRNCYLKNINNYTKNSYIIPCDSLQPDVIYERVHKLIDGAKL